MANNDHNPSERRTGHLLFLIYLLLAAGIIATGIVYYRSQERRLRAEVEQRLSAVADLKADELAVWRRERLGDGAVLFKNAAFSSLARRFFGKPEDSESRQPLQEWVEKYLTLDQYDQLCLVDAQGVTRLEVPSGRPPMSAIVLQHIPEVLQSGRVTLQDFYRSEHDRRIHLAVLVPIFDETAAGRPLGVLVMRIDPATQLYPFIRWWPTLSQTAETLIVRREGNEVLFLNELRFQPDSALNLVSSIKNTDLPAVKAALGQEGIVEGTDYRGVPVVAALRSIPNSPWFLVARMDVAEIYAPMRERLWQVVVLVGALLFASGAGIGLVWRHQRVLFYKERLKGAEALRQSEERFRMLFEQAGAGVALIETATGHFVRVNRKYCDMLGFTADELSRLDFRTITHPDDSDADLNNIERLRSGEVRSFTMEKRYFRKDGAVIWVSLTISPLSLAGVDSEFEIAVAEDISERKQAEEALRASEERFQRAVVDSPFPILLHAEDGTILLASNSWCEFTGYTREELATINDWTERAYGERKERVQADIDALYGLDHRKAEGEYSIRIKDGATRIWDFSSAPLGRLPDGRRLVLSMAMDVTERREAENQVRRLNAELEQRVKDRTRQLEDANKELEAFSYSVSHDLRAPLRAIDGFGRILTEEHSPHLCAEGRRLLDIVCDEAKRMGQLIDDLLAFSGIGRRSMDLQDVDMKALANAVFNGCVAHTLGRKIRFMLPSLPPVHGDPAMLRQVLINLIDNALKYTRSRDVAEIEVGSYPEGEMNVYFIKDNGVGFEIKYVHKLFGVFQRLHSAAEFEGTGVGLALVQRVIHRHGGRVWAEGNVNEGAAFYFTLPRRTE